MNICIRIFKDEGYFTTYSISNLKNLILVSKSFYQELKDYYYFCKWKFSICSLSFNNIFEYHPLYSLSELLEEHIINENLFKPFSIHSNLGYSLKSHSLTKFYNSLPERDKQKWLYNRSWIELNDSIRPHEILLIM